MLGAFWGGALDLGGFYDTGFFADRSTLVFGIGLLLFVMFVGALRQECI